MYYELYVDSLFVVNFVMNLYVLILVNGSTLRTATRRRMFAGAGVGAISYLLPFVVPLPVWIKYPAAFVGGTWLMIHITFRPDGIRGFFKILKWMSMYSFVMGGLLLFAMNTLPFAHYLATEIVAVCGIGAVGVMFISWLGERQRRKSIQSSCRATLISSSNRIVVQALLDSGNSLIEPISGKPVSVIDGEIYHKLWGSTERPFRAIPYHSIGRKRGILKGYLLPELELEIDGVTKRLSDVYVAVSDECGSVPVIVNPAVLNG